MSVSRRLGGGLGTSPRRMSSSFTSVASSSGHSPSRHSYSPQPGAGRYMQELRDARDRNVELENRVFELEAIIALLEKRAAQPGASFRIDATERGRMREQMAASKAEWGGAYHAQRQRNCELAMANSELMSANTSLVRQLDARGGALQHVSSQARASRVDELAAAALRRPQHPDPVGGGLASALSGEDVGLGRLVAAAVLRRIKRKAEGYGVPCTQDHELDFATTLAHDSAAAELLAEVLREIPLADLVARATAAALRRRAAHAARAGAARAGEGRQGHWEYQEEEERQGHPEYQEEEERHGHRENQEEERQGHPEHRGERHERHVLRGETSLVSWGSRLV